MREENTKNGIKIARDRKKLTREQLASYLNVDVNVINSWENDEGIILIPQLEKMKNVLGTSYEMLLYNEERKGLKISHLKCYQQEFVIKLHKIMRNVVESKAQDTLKKRKNKEFLNTMLEIETKKSSKGMEEKILYLRNNFVQLKQTEFAKKINVSRHTIIKWEDKQMKPNLYNVKMIANYCGVTTDYLLDDSCSLELCTRGLKDSGYKMLKSLIKYFENENSAEENK